MKLFHYCSILILSFCLSCQGNTEKSDSENESLTENTENSGTDSETSDTDTMDSTAVEVETNCGGISKFDQFLGIQYGDNELEIQDRIGKFTSGNYSRDSSAFIYYFNRVDHVPLSVWVNAGTGKVITVFMEILSFKESFEGDKEKVREEFAISDCDIDWFGMTEDDIVNEMGKPDVRNVDQDSVLTLAYDSKDFLYSVSFKLYPSQEDLCSSVSLNWFY